MDIIYKINKYTDKLKDLYIRKNYNIDTYNNYATKLNYYYSIFGGAKTPGDTSTDKTKFIEEASLLDSTTDDIEDNDSANNKKKKKKEKGKVKPKDPKILTLDGATTQSSESDGTKTKKKAKNDKAKAGEAKSGEAKPVKPKLTEDEIKANRAASQARKEERNAQQKTEGKAKAKEQKETSTFQTSVGVSKTEQTYNSIWSGSLITDTYRTYSLDEQLVKHNKQPNLIYNNK